MNFQLCVLKYFSLWFFASSNIYFMVNFISSIKGKIRFYLIEKLNVNFSILRSYYFRKNLNNISDTNSEGQITVYLKDDPILIRTNSSDEEVYFQIFIEREYQFLLDLIQKYLGLNSVKVLLDIGANIGLTTRFLSDKIDFEVVYAIEPDPENFKQLELNLSRLNAQTHLINKAVWSRLAYLEFSNFRDGKSWSKCVKESEVKKGESFSSTCLEEIIDNFEIESIDILKIDIEGSERSLLADPEQFIRALEITKFLAIELHDEVVSRIDFTEFIQDLGFRIFAKGETLYGVNMKLMK